MKKKFFIAVIAISIFIPIVQSCSDSHRGENAIIKIVEEISKTDKDLGKGKKLTSCGFSKGDSVITYRISVDDTRYSNVDVDSIRKNLLHSLSNMKSLDSGLQIKLIKTLKNNSLGIRYIYTYPDGEKEVILTPADIKSISY